MGMTRLEQIEKLREKANVTYDEAKNALEMHDGDLLDAIIYLEKQGKVAPPTGNGKHSSERPVIHPVTDDSPEQGESGLDRLWDVLGKVGKFFVDLLNKGNAYTFEVSHKDERKVRIPVTAAVLLVLFLPWISIPLLVLGLIFDYRYRIIEPRNPNGNGDISER